MTGVEINRETLADPRFSRSQRQALEDALGADPRARILGLDYGMRPVVAARLGVPPLLRVYAVLRNGDPADPKPVTPDGDWFLKEEWGA